MKLRLLLVLIAPLAISSCVKKAGDDTAKDTVTTVSSNSTMTTQSVPTATQNNNYPVTLPVIDAFFSDSSFASGAKSQAGLTDAEISRVRDLARRETATTQSTDNSSTAFARQNAVQKLSDALGADKANKFINYVQSRWSGSGTADSNSVGAAAGKYNQVPQDSRIVVNAPEYRMDVFDSGKLVKSYKIAIGYPEFPLPTALRHASKIIFNPSWTTPDEPWVESSKKVTVGQTVKPGDKLNPLGIMKIPIGLPSLIHGGKSAGQLGTFGSHGCVGLTNDEAKDFVKQISKLAGDSISDQDIAQNIKSKDQSKEVNLKQSVPVEIRYETIVLEDGSLHIFRDVYDHNTNTDSTLNAVLQTYGVSMSGLSQPEQDQIKAAIAQMSRDANGNPTNQTTADSTASAVAATSSATNHKSASHAAGLTGKNSSSDTSSNSVHLTKTVKGTKEIVIPIAELAGKGYPAMPGQSTKSKSTASGNKKR